MKELIDICQMRLTGWSLASNLRASTKPRCTTVQQALVIQHCTVSRRLCCWCCCSSQPLPRQLQQVCLCLH